VTEIKILREIELSMGARSAVAVLFAALALAVPATAVAGQEDCAGPAGDQYCPQTQILTGGGSGSGDDSGGGDTSGDLPFTGLDLTLSVVAAAGLLGAGLALRRFSHARGSAE
jgi:hypothetical protein